MRVGIVGAGLAGLAAGRELMKAGHEPVLFEKSRGLGGRLATRRIGPYTFDTGATTLAPRGREIEPWIVDDPDVRKIERPVYVHEQTRVVEGDRKKNDIVRYAYPQGVTRLPKRLAEGLEIRRETRVEALEKANGGYRMADEEFDAIIVTAPIPQTLDLLNTIGETRPARTCTYRNCLSVLLAFDRDFDAPFYALVDAEAGYPLTWLSVETLKVEGRAPEGHTAVVAQMSPRYSKWKYDSDDEAILQDTVVDVSRLMGGAFTSPVEAQVKRWRYSQPENTVSYESMNREGSRLIVASDGLLGGRAELAFEVGLRAARSLSSL